MTIWPNKTAPQIFHQELVKPNASRTSLGDNRRFTPHLSQRLSALINRSTQARSDSEELIVAQISIVQQATNA